MAFEEAEPILKPFFRCPGGKSLVAKRISGIIFGMCGVFRDYREAFVGGGSVGLEVMEHLEPGAKVWINDKDNALMGIWKMVRDSPEQLISMVRGYEPDLKDFYEFRYRLLHPTNESWIDRGMMSLVVHQLSFSGLGTMGGVLGGELQRGRQRVDCRWSANMDKNILQAHELFKRFDVRCTAMDYIDVLQNVTDETVVYCDAPYFVQGNALYQYGFSCREHQKLAEVLKGLRCRWFVSYDDCEEVRRLYDWANIRELSNTYTMSNVRKTSELLITPSP